MAVMTDRNSSSRLQRKSIAVMLNFYTSAVDPQSKICTQSRQKKNKTTITVVLMQNFTQMMLQDQCHKLARTGYFCSSVLFINPLYRCDPLFSPQEE